MRIPGFSPTARQRHRLLRVGAPPLTHLCGNAAIASRRNADGAPFQISRQAHAFQHAPPQAEFKKLSSVLQTRFPLMRLPDLGSR